MKAEGDTEHKQGLFNYKFPVSDLGGADLNDLVAQVWLLGTWQIKMS